MKNLLSKIRELPGHKKKAISWIAMTPLTLGLFILYVKHVQKKVAGINMERTREELQLPFLGEILNKVSGVEIPKIEMPKIDQEAIQELERIIEETSKEGIYGEPIE